MRRVLPFYIAASAIVSMFLHSHAYACSFGGADVFVPTLERWEQHPGPAQTGGVGDYWEKVPAPVVTIIEVTRGTAKPGASCADAGTVSLSIALPPESTYDISEFGFYFRVVRGKLPDEIFPDIPLIGRVENNKSTILLAWLDGHPSKQIALDIEVEVTLVTNGLNIGSPTKIKITSD